MLNNKRLEMMLEVAVKSDIRGGALSARLLYGAHDPSGLLPRDNDPHRNR